MIRVLHYVGIMNRGGMETLIMNLYRNIDRTKIQFDFAVHGQEDGAFDSEIQSLGGKIYRFPHMRKNPSKYRDSWATFFKKNHSNYKVFHFHTNSLANIIALKEAQKYDIPIRIVHSHSSYAKKGRLQGIHDLIHKRNRKHILKYANKFIACSTKASDWLFGSNFEKSYIMKNGIELNKYVFNKTIRTELRNRLGLDCKFTVCHIGNFVEAKNHKFVIDIFKEVQKLTNNNARLLLVGSGNLQESIREYVKKCNLSKEVIFLGVRNDVEKILMASDAFILPSLFEGFGIVAIEAQASGLPCVVSKEIPKEALVTDKVSNFDLSLSAEEWAKSVVYNGISQKKDRENYASLVSENGYDILNTVSSYYDLLSLSKESD
ncbi:glycosyltransferase family 1 protein [Marinilactibacillus psychrotolerans]|uniref:glycosyltransferase family 1 protein n=1 Tax=Marinilactibacillus psychrotolerans TaxID=191770 RepID=UPI00388472C0